MSEQNVPERLKETSENCLTAYSSWAEDRKNADKRGIMAEAVHELRKVASRLEIEMAISERDEQSKKPIPIPNHRASKQRNNNNNGHRNNKPGNVGTKPENDLPDFISKDSDTTKSADKPKKAPPRRKRASTSGDSE